MDFRTKLEKQIFGVRATALIVKDRKLLLCYQEGSQKYYTIGGAIKVGESTEDAVIRVVRENLGLEVTVKQLVFIVENEFTVADNLVNIDVVPAFLKKRLPIWSGTIEQIRIKEKNK